VLLSNEIILSLIQCEYKGHLKSSGTIGKKHDFEKHFDHLKKDYTARFESQHKKILKASKKNDIVNYDEGDIIKDVKVNTGNFLLTIEYLEIIRDRKDKKLKAIPIFIYPRNKITTDFKLFVSFVVLKLNDTNSFYGQHAIILFGSSFKKTKVLLKTHHSDVNRLLGKIDNIGNSNVLLTKKCESCEFFEGCSKLAKEEDLLCQISGVTRNDIKKKNSKGIFTLTQLSYTFRPRRNKANKKAITKKRKIELQALAIRENKVHIYEYPEIERKQTEVYVDIEGIPDDDYYYLIGICVRNKDKFILKSFWADDKEEQVSIFIDFLDYFETLGDCSVYHYGSYERTAFRKIKKIIPEDKKEIIDRLLSNSVDILSTINTSIYFPVYKYGLKDIAKFIGYSWFTESASGLMSIVWRKEWEGSKADEQKQKLITYNLDDCKALLNVKDYVFELTNSKGENGIVVDDLAKKQYSLNFLSRNYSLPEIKDIHEHSSFDYQREHVFVKTKNPKGSATQKKRKKRRRKYPFNKVTYKHSIKCPVCGTRSYSLNSELRKKIIDLQIKKTSIKRWVTQYRTHHHYCPHCKKTYIPSSYLEVRYKYGHSLVAYTMYQNIENKHSFLQISKNFLEFFDLEIGTTTLNDFKMRFAHFYRYTFELLKKRILLSPIIYVDETPIKMRFEKGYIWVLSNNKDVICFYQETREADFIRNLLKDFKGVLVSDFYTAYDTIECQHQKCLLHLIRDLNNDLIQSPFNAELKKITQSFSSLMKKIVQTIDDKGLKKYFLEKHVDSAELFIEEMKIADFKSEVAIKYQKRILKYKDSIFTFLKIDELSWNNNIAEFAIKQLALHQNTNQKHFHKSRIDDYLLAMSLFITCKYHENSFLKFLISMKKSI
jgi:predicted RecB family nuclease